MAEIIGLFWTFFKIGAVFFGGGYAMLPLLTREFVDKRGWVDETEINDYFAIGQVTPGLIAVNVATFIGNKRKGIVGGIAATIGLVCVPVIIITLIASVLTNFAEIELVKRAFAGIRVCVCVLILSAIIKLWKKSVPNVVAIIICAVVFFFSAFGESLGLKVSPVILVVAAAIVGIVVQSLLTKPKDKGGKE